MIFHEFGTEGKPIIVLIHGCFQPWQSLLPISKHFFDDYMVLIPALNGHTSEIESKFISIEQEAAEIESYIIKNYGQGIHALCGLSMGGAIAYTILKNKRLKIDNLILDGAPLISSGKLMTKIMVNNYIKIAQKSKAKDKKTLDNFCKNFMPEKYLNDYLSFIEKTDEESIRNMLISVNENRFSSDLSLKSTKLLYLHGTKSNEILAKKSGKLIAKYYPDAYVVCLKGMGHCECAIYEPDDWAEIVKDFIENR